MAHAEAILSATNGAASNASIPPGFVLIRDVELTAMLRVLTVARATVAAAGDDCRMPALEAALEAVPPAITAHPHAAGGSVREIGPGLYAVGSASQAPMVHVVTVTPYGDWHCDCQSFAYRGACRHTRAVSEHNRPAAALATNE